MLQGKGQGENTQHAHRKAGADIGPILRKRRRILLNVEVHQHHADEPIRHRAGGHNARRIPFRSDHGLKLKPAAIVPRDELFLHPGRIAHGLRLRGRMLIFGGQALKRDGS